MDGNGGGNNNNDNNYFVDNDGNNGTSTMRWQQQQWDDNDLMVMGSKRCAEHLRELCHLSEATINLCQQFGEESTRERDNFGGREDRKGSRWKQFGGDHFIST